MSSDGWRNCAGGPKKARMVCSPESLGLQTRVAYHGGMMTRAVASSFLSLCVIAWPGSAEAQKELFVKGLEELTQAMVVMPPDAGRVRAAVDTMSIGLASWDHPAPPPEAGLLDDAPTAVLPLAAYANGFELIVRGNYDEAIQSLRRAAETSDDERSRLVDAGLLNQQGRVVEAEQALQSILDAWPDSALSRWWLGRIYDALDRVAEARRQYEAVLPVALGGRGHIYAAIGRLARRQGDFDGALEALRRRTQVAPKDPAAHKDLARVLLDRDRSEEALAEFAIVVALDPRDAEAHAAIGRIHLDAGRPTEAIPAFRRAISLMPERHETRYALAMALKQTGHAEEAAQELQRFERADKTSVEDRRRSIAADVKRAAELQDAGR